MTEPTHPVEDPQAQVHYWISQGIRAHTLMSEDEAARSTHALLDQYDKPAQDWITTLQNRLAHSRAPQMQRCQAHEGDG